MWFLLNTCVRTCTLLFTKCSERTISKREELTALEGQVIVDHEPEFSNLALDTIGFGVFNFDFDSSVLKFQPWAGRRDCSSSSTPLASWNTRRRSTTRHLLYYKHWAVDTLIFTHTYEALTAHGGGLWITRGVSGGSTRLACCRQQQGVLPE